MLERIEEEARAAVRGGGLLHANVLETDVLNNDRAAAGGETPNLFDIVVTIFTLESACSTLEQYREALRNVVSLLRPGGPLILGSVIEDDV